MVLEKSTSSDVLFRLLRLREELLPQKYIEFVEKLFRANPTHADEVVDFTALSCTRESYFHSIHIHGRAHSTTSIETSRISLLRGQRNRRAVSGFFASIEDCDSRICFDLAFHSSMRVRR
jgi:hypothetical protein